MKKTVSILIPLVLLVCLLGTALADIPTISKFDGTFSVRNGISFGMSGKDVEAIETGLGSSKVYNKEYLEFKGSAAGYSDVYVRYYFNQKSSMNDLYTFDYEIGRLADWTQSEGAKEYEKLVNAMLSKYGNPFYSAKDEELFPLFSSAYNFLGVVEDYYNLRDFNQWIVEYDDGYIVIDAVLSQMDKSIISSSYPYFCHIGYRRITKQDFDQVMLQLDQNKKNKEEAINNDL